jgi:hypothetical protein
MSRKRILWIAVFLFVLPFTIYWRADAEKTEWKIYDSDKLATHYYLFKGIRSLGKSDIGVWVRIIPKGPNKLLLKEIYGKGICEGIDLSDLKEIKCSVEINCFNKKYRVVEGLFEREFLIGICEPPYELVKWIDISSGSPIEKLLKIICPK